MSPPQRPPKQRRELVPSHHARRRYHPVPHSVGSHVAHGLLACGGPHVLFCDGHQRGQLPWTFMTEELLFQETALRLPPSRPVRRGSKPFSLQSVAPECVYVCTCGVGATVLSTRPHTILLSPRCPCSWQLPVTHHSSCSHPTCDP